MRIKRLENGDFHIHVDCDLRTARERKLFVKVDENGTPTHPEAMPIIVRLGRAMRMVEMLKSGTYTSQNEVAESMAMSRSMVSRVLRTAFLSPVIVERLRIRNSRRPTWSPDGSPFRGSSNSPKRST